MRIGASLIIAIVMTAAVAQFSFCDMEYSPDELMTSEGKVTAIDVSSSRITVMNGSAKTFIVPSGASISRSDGAEGGLSDISVGDYVVIGYVAKEGSPDKVLTVRVKYQKAEKIW